MANTEAVGGVDTFLLYAEESTYNSDPGSGYVHFGHIKRFSHTPSNNMYYGRSFKGTTTGGRDIAKFAAGKLGVTASAEFDVIQWQFLKFVLGSESGTGPYQYSGADVPPSITLHRCIDNPGASATDQDLIITGAVINSCTVRCSVGEQVSCTLDFLGALVAYDTTILGAVALPDRNLFTFAGGSIELPDGSAISNIIDSVEITVSNNYEILYGVGSRLGQNAKPKAREYKIRFTLKYLDNDMLDKLLGASTPTAAGGPTESATIALKFEEGDKSCDFVFSGFVFDEGTFTDELNEVLTEDLRGTAKTLIATDDRT